MLFEFRDRNLERLFREEAGPLKSKYSASVLRQFALVMQIIDTAKDERDLRAFKGRRFEKLQGSRTHHYSMRLDIQFRLTLEMKGTSPETIVVVSIEDYH